LQDDLLSLLLVLLVPLPDSLQLRLRGRHHLSGGLLLLLGRLKYDLLGLLLRQLVLAAEEILRRLPHGETVRGGLLLLLGELRHDLLGLLLCLFVRRADGFQLLVNGRLPLLVGLVLRLLGGGELGLELADSVNLCRGFLPIIHHINNLLPVADDLQVLRLPVLLVPVLLVLLSRDREDAFPHERPPGGGPDHHCSRLERRSSLLLGLDRRRSALAPQRSARRGGGTRRRRGGRGGGRVDGGHDGDDRRGRQDRPSPFPRRRADLGQGRTDASALPESTEDGGLLILSPRVIAVVLPTNKQGGRGRGRPRGWNEWNPDYRRRISGLRPSGAEGPDVRGGR